MKGYSFDELVKLAMAAVPITGNVTMSGPLSAPKFTMTNGQGTAAGDAVRFDYLGGQIPNRSTGIPSAADLNNYQTPGFYHQSSDVHAASGSNYPTSQAGTLLVFRHPGVCQIYIAYPNTGNRRIYYRNLYVSTWSAWTTVYDTNYKPTPADIGAVAVNGENVDQPIALRLARGIYTGNSAAPLEIGHGAKSSGNFYIDIHTTNPAIDYDYRWSYLTGGTGAIFSSKITAEGLEVTSQGSNAASVARRDYVDTELGKKLNLAGDTMTGDLTTPKVLVSSAQGTESNALTRRDYVNGEIAKQVSKSGDTMTGDLTAPKVLVSGAQGAEVNALTRKDYVDGQVATRAPSAHTHPWSEVTGAPVTATRWPEWSEVSSKPSTFTPSVHSHTAAEGNSDIVAGSYGQIGTYGFFYNLGTVASVGTQRSGSTLRWNAARDKSTANINPSGTWKCLGHASQNGSSEGEACTLWVRIA